MAFVILAGCSGGGGSDLRQVDDLRELSYTEEVRIGSLEDPVLGFSQIRQVRVSENGDVFVLEGQAREVRVFTAQGEPIRVLGGVGQGPGEFSRPMSLGLLGDTLWVTDLLNRRVTWFGPDGSVLFSTPAPGVAYDTGDPSISVSLVPARPRPDGLIESDRGMMSYMLNGALSPYQYPVLLFSRDGEVMDTMRWETSEPFTGYFEVGGRGGYAPVLESPRPWKATPPDGGVVIVDWQVSEDGSEGWMEVVKTDLSGDTLYSQRLNFTPLSVPGHVADSLIEPRLEAATVYGVTEAEMQAALRAAITLPEYRAPIRTIHGGSDGTLWLQSNTSSSDANDWIAIDRDGDPIGGLRLPRRMTIADSAYPIVWAIETDELDVPWLVKLTINEMGNEQN
jgi:hypothetical protein